MKPVEEVRIESEIDVKVPEKKSEFRDFCELLKKNTILIKYDTFIVFLLVMVVMEIRMRLPGPNGSHFDSGMITKSVVVGI